VSALDEAIDDLYRLPLGEFTAARNALAKTLKPPDKARIQGLAKPTVVPWAVNQLYWSARPAYDRAMKAGAALRTAQIGALEGRPSHIAKAADAHREAVREAATRALALGAKHDQHPQAEVVTRMIEALSLSPETPAHPGRLTEIVQPSGFEALAGLDPLRITGFRPAPPSVSKATARHDEHSPAADTEAANRHAQAQAAVQAAEASLARLRQQADRAQQLLATAEARVVEARDAAKRADGAVTDADADLARAREALAENPPPAGRTRQQRRV
jgi:hypothetical protein